MFEVDFNKNKSVLRILFLDIYDPNWLDSKPLVLYSQHSIFFATYELAQ
jgi:hypothetical protein